MPSGRPPGVSSRLHRAPRRGTWVAPNGEAVDLPLVLDILEVTADGARVEWKVEATVDLVEGEPKLVALVLQHPSGVDAHRMRREFRWATPVEIVTRTVPTLLARGIDPFQHEYATTGYPDAANPGRSPGRQLSDEFLEEIAQRYVALGRGYSDALAEEYSVSRRTAISWVEKARRRGILSGTSPGAVGGQVRSNG